MIVNTLYFIFFIFNLFHSSAQAFSVYQYPSRENYPYSYFMNESHYSLDKQDKKTLVVYQFLKDLQKKKISSDIFKDKYYSIAQEILKPFLINEQWQLKRWDLSWLMMDDSQSFFTYVGELVLWISDFPLRMDVYIEEHTDVVKIYSLKVDFNKIEKIDPDFYPYFNWRDWERTEKNQH